MKQRILLIDNDKILNRINEKILHKAGLVCDLRTATNGYDALEYLKRCLEQQHALPDLIIFDLDMPIMDGFEFIDAFNKLTLPKKDKIEMIVFSYSTHWKERQKALLKGVRHYIDKPYLLPGLVDIIQNRSNNVVRILHDDRRTVL